MWLALGLLTWLIATIVAAPAWADEPVIEEGRERDVLGLFAPYELGGEVLPGWILSEVQIEPTRVIVAALGPRAERSEIVLVHEDAAESEEVTASFAVLRSPTDNEVARHVQTRLIEAVRRNDGGRFWRAIRPLPIDRPISRGPPRLGVWLAFDGLVLLVGLVLVVVALTVRALRSAPGWVKLAVPSAFLAGLALRLALAPPALLGAWPWSRMAPHARSVFESALAAAFVERFGLSVPYTDLSFSIGLVYAGLMPLVLFAHATQVLRDPRAGAFASIAVALSPHHIRFSRCEDAFVPSLVLTSTAFALLHTFLRDRVRPMRIAAAAILPLVLWPAYLLRPLNILFVGIFVWAAVALHPAEAPRSRRAIGAAIVALVGGGALLELRRAHSEQLADAGGAPWVWLSRVPGTLLDPELNVLLQPGLTPPVLLVLAGIGVWSLVRRGERRLARFLAAWLAVFFVAHCYVVDAPMMPRYHLHLLVPLLLTAAVGAIEAARRSRPAIMLAVGGLFVTPLLARHVVGDLSYADQREHTFVSRARDLVPGGCTVVEYVGDEGSADARFARIGLRLGGPSPQRFVSRAVGRSEGPAALAEAVLSAPGECVFVYEGLPCWGGKERSEPYAPACAALGSIEGLDLAAEETFAPKTYERRVLRGLDPAAGAVTLRLRKRSGPPR